MDIRDPKVLFGVGVAGFFALLALTDERSARAATPDVSPFVPPAPTSGPTVLTTHLSDGFFRQIVEMEREFQARGARVTGEDFLGVLKAESAVSPLAKNASSGCAGMNQICPTRAADPLSGLKAVGFNGTSDEYRSLSAEAQLPFVRRWFNTAAQGQFPALTNMGRLYLLNFAPAHVGKPADFPLFVRGRDGNAYEFNKGLDREGKGFITPNDTDRFVHASLANNPKSGLPAFAYWNELRMRLNRVRSGEV